MLRPVSLRFVQALITIAFYFNISVYGQDFPYEVPQYEFVNYKDNIIQGPDTLKGLGIFYRNWKRLVVSGKGNVEILHIGDSHIQADFFTGQVRRRMHEFFHGLEGARGFVFPYNLAGINNPFNYIISSESSWESTLSTKIKSNASIGMAGVTLQTNDSIFSLVIKQLDSLPNSGFENIDIWYTSQDTILLRYSIGGKDFSDIVFPDGEQVEISLPSLQKELHLFFHRQSNHSGFVLEGLVLENDLPGITYHAVGLNGATAESFNRCNKLKDQLGRLSPDLIIVSLGTNDIYGINPSIESFLIQYGKLLQTVRDVLPSTALVLTTPGDHFIQGHIPNQKVDEAAQVIKELGVRFDAGVWDFYHIMGGYQSMMAWRACDLGSKDKVHLSKTGYVLQGNLFFNALLKRFEPYLAGNPSNE